MIRDTANFKKCAVTKCQKKGIFVNNICDTCTKQLKKSYKERRPIRRSAQLKKESDREHSKAMREAKKYFQMWGRLRDADELGMVKCVHGAYKHYTEIDGGHYIPADIKSTCFDEININPQEKIMNMRMMHPLVNQEYTDYMIDRYGQDEVEKLEARSYLTVKYLLFELKEIAKKYKTMCDEKVKSLRL